MNICIMPAKGWSDMLALAALHIAAHQEAHGEYHRTIEEVARIWQSTSDISPSIARGPNGEGVGFIAQKSLPDDEIFITDMFIRPDFRNMGIGKNLLRQALTKKFGSLMVWDGNKPAIALYQKMGFAPIGASIRDEHGRMMIHMKWTRNP